MNKLIVSFLFLVVGVLGVCLYLPKNYVQLNENLKSSSQVSNEQVTRKETTKIFSPDDKAYVVLRSEIIDGKLRLRLIGSINGGTVDPKDPFVLFEATFPDTSHTISENDIVWSPKGDKLAISLGKGVELFYYEQGEYFPVMTGSLSLALPDDDREFGRRMFFSGDGTELYVVSDEVRKALLSNQYPRFELLQGVGIHIYPVPSSSGYVTWVRKQYPEKHAIEIHAGSGIKTYSSLLDADYFGKILLSTRLTHACIENGSSGYWGYSLVRLQTGKQLFAGPQYSACIRWLDDTRVVVEENVYNFSQKNPHYYLLDTVTNKKDLLLIRPMDDIHITDY